MNRILSSVIIIVFAACTFLPAARAADQPNLPESSWEKHPDVGVDLAVLLPALPQGGPEAIGANSGDARFAIQVYIKNTSKQSIAFTGVDAGNTDFEIDYKNDQDVVVPLRKAEGLIDAKAVPIEIKSGETLVRSVELTRAELAAIKGRPVQCVIILYSDMSWKPGKLMTLKTAPKIVAP